MLQLKVNNQYLDLDSDTRIQLTLRNPMFFRDKDGSASYNFTIPATDKNSIILSNYGKITSKDNITSINGVDILFDGHKLFSDGTLFINKYNGKTYDCTVGVEKGNFNYKAQHTQLTELKYDPVTFNFTPLNFTQIQNPNLVHDSILSVVSKKYPEAKFAYFPVYNPGLFSGTFFDEFYNLTAERFKQMVMIVPFYILTGSPGVPGYFDLLKNDGFISDYTEPDGTAKTYYDDWVRKIDDFYSVSDRYSNDTANQPYHMYYFYYYFIQFVNTMGLSQNYVNEWRLNNTFQAAGWVNYIDISFLQHTYQPKKFHTVPFPYFCECIKKCIDALGYTGGKNLFLDDEELRTLCLITMNQADTGLDGTLPDTNTFSVLLNQHMPDLSIFEFFNRICNFFNASLFINKDHSVSIRSNIDILKSNKFREWSSNITFRESSITRQKFKFHINNENDDWFSNNVKQDGVLRFQRIPDVWSVQDLPDAWTVIQKINVICWVNDHQAFYITAFQNSQLTWIQYTRKDSDYIAFSEYEDENSVSVDIGYLLNSNGGWYAGSDSHIFAQQNLDFPYWEFPRCDMKGNGLLHEISFDTEYQKTSLKLMFYRGLQNFSPNPLANADRLPLATADDHHQGKPILGANYSLLWDGENGVYKKFWEEWVYWWNNSGKDAAMTKVLPPAEIANFDWAEKKMINSVLFFIKDLQFDISLYSISPVECTLKRV